MVENTRDLVSLHEPDGKYLYLSPSCDRLLGYKKDELIGTNPGHLVHPDNLERVVAELEKLALKEISSSKLTYQIRQKSGDYIWLETYTQRFLITKEKLATSSVPHEILLTVRM
jgi:PAS domain S-box-containing protein